MPNPAYAYRTGRRAAPAVAVRLAYWRQAVLATGCPACGAAEGQACALGQGDDCAACGRLSGCATGSRLHQARLDAWLRPGPPARPGRR